MPFSPAITAIAIGIYTLLAFGGGFAVSHWRDSGEMERLRSDKKIVEAVNKKCVADLGEVRQSVASLLDMEAVLRKEAQKAQKDVQPAVEKHQARITRIKQLPPVVASDQQCMAIKLEQIDYVKLRREDAQ